MIVLVTGATSGSAPPSRAASRRAASRHRRRPADRAARRAGGRVRRGLLTLPLDVRDRAAVAARSAGCRRSWPEIDVLVNNAGLALGLEPAQRADLDDWERWSTPTSRG